MNQHTYHDLTDAASDIVALSFTPGPKTNAMELITELEAQEILRALRALRAVMTPPAYDGTHSYLRIEG